MRRRRTAFGGDREAVVLEFEFISRKNRLQEINEGVTPAAASVSDVFGMTAHDRLGSLPLDRQIPRQMPVQHVGAPAFDLRRDEVLRKIE